MDGLRQDLRQAVRMLVKSPGFSAVVVATVAVGIGANALVFSFVSGVLLAPFPFAEPERLVALREANPRRDLSPSFPNYADWAAQAKSFSSMGATRVQEFSLTGPAGPERVAGARATASLFTTLGVVPILGQPFTPGDDLASSAPVVLLGHGLWSRNFGADPGVVGRSVVLDGRSATVVGVMPRELKFPAVAELWTPMATDAGESPRSTRNLAVVARLADGVDLEQARAEMAAISARLERDHAENREMRALVLPLRDLYVRQGRPALYVMAVAVAFVLAIACLNVANLLLARGAARSGEIAIRTSLGASRWRVVRQLLAESLLLSLAGGAVGMLLPGPAINGILGSLPFPIPFWMNLAVDYRVLAFAAAASVATGIAFGLAPALQTSRIEINSLLKDRGLGDAGGRRRHRIRNALVVGEIALSVVLLTCAGFLARSFLRLQQLEPGFEAESVLTAQMAPLSSVRHPGDREVASFFAGLLERLRGLPGVTAAAANSQIPLQSSGGMEAGFYVEGRERSESDAHLAANYQVVTPGYFQALEIPVLRGREFLEGDTLDAPGVAVVNQRMAARFWPDGAPVGQRLSLGGPQGPWLEVVGVVGDVRHRGLDRDMLLDVYVPHGQSPQRAMTLVVRGQRGVAGLAGRVREQVAALDRDQPVFRIRPMEQVVADSLWMHRFNSRLFVVFAAAAVGLAAVGLYGVVAYSVAQRTQEIGVRMALGATTVDVLRLVLRQGLALVLVGVGLGLPAALALGIGLASVLHSVEPYDPGVLLGVPLVLALVSLAACCVPARRASRIAPLAALRQEAGGVPGPRAGERQAGAAGTAS